MNTSISKNVCIDKLGDAVNKYNNTYHSTIKMKPVDVKSNTYLNSSMESNDEDPKFKIGNIVRISKYKNIFAKGYAPNWSEKVFMTEKVKKNCAVDYVISNSKGEETVGTFYEKELQNLNQKEFRVEKVIKRKGDKLNIIWKGSDNLFNSWVDKKDIV